MWIVLILQLSANAKWGCATEVPGPDRFSEIFKMPGRMIAKCHKSPRNFIKLPWNLRNLDMFLQSIKIVWQEGWIIKIPRFEPAHFWRFFWSFCAIWSALDVFCPVVGRRLPPMRHSVGSVNYDKRTGDTWYATLAPLFFVKKAFNVIFAPIDAPSQGIFDNNLFSLEISHTFPTQNGFLQVFRLSPSLVAYILFWLTNSRPSLLATPMVSLHTRK